MAPTDVISPETNKAGLLRPSAARAGFEVDMQSMDWAVCRYNAVQTVAWSAEAASGNLFPLPNWMVPECLTRWFNIMLNAGVGDDVVRLSLMILKSKAMAGRVCDC